MSHGLILVDSREKDQALRAAASRVEGLSYPNPADPGHPHSWDIEVHTLGGQRLRFERKVTSDFVSSFLNEQKMDRQASMVDALIVEWDPLAIALNRPDASKDPIAAKQYDIKMSAARKHLARMSMAMPVIKTQNVEETIEIMQYLARKTDDVAIFKNRINVKAPTLREKMIRALSPSITPDQFTNEIWPAIDHPSFLAALNIDLWPVATQVSNRIKEDLAHV